MDSGGQTQPGDAEHGGADGPGQPPGQLVASEAGQQLAEDSGPPLKESAEVGVNPGPRGSHDADHKECEEGNTCTNLNEEHQVDDEKWFPDVGISHSLSDRLAGLRVSRGRLPAV